VSYLSKVANFNLPHLYLAPPFTRILGVRKQGSLGYYVALFAWSCI